MDQDLVHMVAASKVPMLKPGVKTTISPSTAKEKAQRRLELKARSTVLMGIPNEHQLKFNSIKDAKSLLQAIKKSQLEIHGESILQEDVNQKFLRSLSPEWNTHTIVWRNKPEIDTLSLGDLYNNLKIYEPDVKGTSISSTNTQNVAFVSSNSINNTNGAVNTAHGVTTASTQATTVNSITIDNLSDDVICAFFASQPNSPQLDNEDLQQINPDNLEYMDLRCPRWSVTTATKTTHFMIRVIKQKKVQLTLHSWLTLLQILTLSLESVEARLLVYKKNESDYKEDIKEVDINKKTENQAKMTKLSMEWKRLCKIKAKVQKYQSQSQYRRISSRTGAGTEEYY
ncbi:hypothetical protein Tco_0490560 [Tanacetum coccineum]